jgi:hypothetical protein
MAGKVAAIEIQYQFRPVRGVGSTPSLSGRKATDA